MAIVRELRQPAFSLPMQTAQDLLPADYVNQSWQARFQVPVNPPWAEYRVCFPDDGKTVVIERDVSEGMPTSYNGPGFTIPKIRDVCSIQAINYVQGKILWEHRGSYLGSIPSRGLITRLSYQGSTDVAEIVESASGKVVASTIIKGFDDDGIWLIQDPPGYVKASRVRDYMGNYRYDVVRYDLATQQTLRLATIPDGRSRGASPDGRTFHYFQSSQLTFLDTITGEVLGKVPTHSALANYSGDSRRVLYCEMTEPYDPSHPRHRICTLRLSAQWNNH